MGHRITVDAAAYIALSGYLLLMPFHWVVGVLGAAAVHELGHCVAIWMTGGEIYQIRVGAFGARIETAPMGDREALICALAGPLAGSLLCLFWRWIPTAALCALVQTFFNLMPVYPFDGGRALRAARGMWKDKAVAKSSSSLYNNPD